MPETPVVLSRRSCGTATQPISYFMQQAVENPDLITLAAGLVDPESLPAGEVSRALDEILSNPDSARAALQYGTTQGYAPLREKLLARVAALDHVTPGQLSLTPEEVVVTTGSQQLLYLVTELLCDPGDLVIVEAPSYFVYLGLLESLGVRALTVPTDEQGMNTDALEELLDRLDRSGELERLRIIYTCDYFQNPSGLTLSLPRRGHLLDLARRYSRRQRLFVLEDAAYRELNYGSPGTGTGNHTADLPSVKSLDEGNQHVILAMSFSKSCSPGLKTGYGFLPRELVGPVVGLKGSHDFGSNNLAQHLLDRLLSSGAYDRHVANLCRVYRQKRDALLEALEREFASWPAMHWTRPEGGLYVWLAFPPGVDAGPDSPLMQAALREGVLYVPGQFCAPRSGDVPAHTREARLSFGPVPVEKIGEAICRLARAARPLLHCTAAQASTRGAN
jgi:2-aminoadipate transaminase